MKFSSLGPISLVACTVVLGCRASDDDYFHRTTELRMAGIVAAAKELSAQHEFNDIEDLLRLSSADGLIPKGDVEAVKKDAWGTTFKLENETDGMMTIRSAGEDSVFLTSDDIVKHIN
ncbi:MAG: hypothetical protein OSA88_13205 [Acidimicrobiales bacterium]|nr:hypothetical protein [Acidimicrobiales bacterium]